MNDESYILENKENVLLVEFPAFYDNLEEFEKYVKELNVKYIEVKPELNFKDKEITQIDDKIKEEIKKTN